MTQCPECGGEREVIPLLSAMGQPMNDRGVAQEVCMNIRCPRFSKRQ